MVTCPGIEIDTKVNVIAVDRKKLEPPTPQKKINKLSKNSLLLEICSENQGNKLIKVKTLNNNTVVTEVHKTINVTKDTVYSETLEQSTEVNTR